MKTWLNYLCFSMSLLMIGCLDLGSDSVEVKNVSMQDLTLFDVSVLYPLPDEEEIKDFYLDASSTSKIDDKRIISNARDLLDGFDDSVVVGFRLDPCFPGMVADHSECNPQIRLVMQPIVSFRAEDVAFHLFYSITQEDVKEMILAMKSFREQLNVDVEGLPLQVHPGFLGEQKLEFYKNTQNMILSKISSSKLTRVTSAFGERFSRWTFRGFDLDASGNKTPMIIPGLSSFIGPGPESMVFRFIDGGTHIIEQNLAFDVDNIYPMVSLEDALIGDADTLELQEAVQAAYKIENPTVHNPNTTDCVSCHVAMQTIEKGQWLDAELSVVQYESDLGLNMEAKYLDQMDYRNLRAFGYLNRDASISRRVINESAEIIKFLQN